jgi:predicted RNase H-like HicB family nuclease/predicted RNA binding protein YcfA (HicA-like mRNA interferase family)
MAKKYSDVRKALTEAGWNVVRQRGSHEVSAHPDREDRIVVAGRTATRCPRGRSVASTCERSRASSMSEYVVIYEQAEDGAWGAFIPDLPGVVALGTMRSEVTERIQEALSAFADDLRDRGRSLPAPHHAAGVIAA